MSIANYQELEAILYETYLNFSEPGERLWITSEIYDEFLIPTPKISKHLLERTQFAYFYVVRFNVEYANFRQRDEETKYIFYPYSIYYIRKGWKYADNFEHIGRIQL